MRRVAFETVANVGSTVTQPIDLPSVHMAGSDAHFAAHLDVGPHGFAVYLSREAEYPVLDIDGTDVQLQQVVDQLQAALIARRTLAR